MGLLASLQQFVQEAQPSQIKNEREVGTLLLSFFALPSLANCSIAVLKTSLNFVEDETLKRLGEILAERESTRTQNGASVPIFFQPVSFAVFCFSEPGTKSFAV